VALYANKAEIKLGLPNFYFSTQKTCQAFFEFFMGGVVTIYQLDL
jgi:hypothetical protein